MLNTNTIMVQVLKNQNNSNELFLEWNKKEIKNIRCSSSYCTNEVEDNAYIVTKIANDKEFILPLCKDCYEITTNYENQSSGDFIDHGSVLSVEEDLLLEYKIK